MPQHIATMEQMSTKFGTEWMWKGINTGSYKVQQLPLSMKLKLYFTKFLA
jgi:hypothetical protein